MSQDNPTTNSPEPQPQPKPEVAKVKPPKPKIPRWRRWRRRLMWLALVLLVIAIGLRFVAVMVLPSLLQNAAGHYGLTAKYERLELSLLGGDVGIWHFTLAPKDGGADLVDAEYARLDLSTLDLLHGRLIIRRVEAEDVHLLVDRNADGTIPLLQRFASLTSSPTAAAQPAAPSSPAGQAGNLDLTSPLQLDVLRLTDVQVHLRDAAVSPALDTTVRLDLLLTDLRSRQRPTQIVVDVSATPVLDVLHFEGTGTARGQELDAALHVEVRGLHPQPMRGYLAPLGLRPVGYGLALQMNAAIKTRAATQPSALAGSIELSGISVAVDGQEAAALDHLALDLDAVDLTTAQAGQLLIEGARVNGQRTSQGMLRAAGFELAGAPAPTARAASPVAAAARPGAPLFVPLHWGLGKLLVRNASASFTDHAISPEADLVVRADEFSLGQISSDHLDAAIPIAGRFAAPGIARDIRLSGQATPFSAEKTTDLQLAVDGIRPDVLKPYLDKLGLESDYTAGRFAAAFHAGVSLPGGSIRAADIRLSAVSLKDGGDLAGLNSLEIAGASFDAGAQLIKIDSIDVDGPEISGRRTAAGALAMLGLHTKPRPAPAVAVATASAASPAVDLAAWPRLQIGRITWKGVHGDFIDEAVMPHSTVSLSDAGVELNDLAIDLNQETPLTRPGKFRAWLAAPGLAGQFMAEGTIDPRPDGSVVDVTVDGRQITADRIAAYFQNTGIEPLLKNGSIHLQSHLAVKKLAGPGVGVSGDLTVNDFRYQDGDVNLVAARQLKIGPVTFKDNKLAIGKIAIDAPLLTARREADGSLVAAGVRIAMPAAAPAGKAMPNMVAPVPAATVPPAAAAAIAPAAQAFSAILSELNIMNASIQWSDDTVRPSASAHLTASTVIGNVVYNQPVKNPATLMLKLHEDSALDDLTVSGTFQPLPEAPSAHLDISGTGLRAGTLASYLPPRIASSLLNGSIKLSLDAGVEHLGQNPMSGHLLVSNLDYRDAGDAGPLLALDSFRIDASRVDLNGGPIVIDGISLAGLDASASRDDHGDIELLGLKLLGSAAVAPAAAPPGPSPAVAPPAIEIKAIGSNALAQITRKKYPLVTLGKLDLGMRRLVLADDTPGAKRLVTLSDFQVQNISPIELLGEDYAQRPPIHLSVAGSVDPVMKSVKIDTAFSPFAEQPSVRMDIAATGIQGGKLASVIPELPPQVDGRELTDGQFKCHLESAIKFHRTDPLNFDLSNGFSLDFDLKGVEFRNGGQGPLLAGVDEIASEGIHVEPATSSVMVKELDITNPAGSVMRDKAGIHAMGFVIKMPSPAAAPASSPATPAASSRPMAAAPVSPAPGPVAAAPAAVDPAGEIRIDSLQISGLTFTAEDRMVDPPLVVPLTGLDFEARGLSSRMLHEDQSARFSMLVNSGPVTLPNKKTGKPDHRELFSQIEASGVIALYPQPKGWIKSSVDGFDLAALQSEAKQFDEDLGGGTFDNALDIRLNGDGTADTRLRPSFTDLDLSEGPSGRLRKLLQLPSPLNIGIAAIQDQDGSITVPLNVPVTLKPFSVHGVFGAVMGGVSSVMITAIAATPMKVANVVTGFLPFGGDKDKQPPAPVVLEFNPAGTSLSNDNLQKIKSLFKRLKDEDKIEVTLRADLGSADVDRAGVLANPSPEDCVDLALRLRARKMQLLTARLAAQQQARTQLASGYGDDADAAVAQLRQIDRNLAAVEDALDAVYDLQKPGAEKQAERRTRAACLQIGQERVEAVRDALLASGIEGLSKRVEVTHASAKVADGVTTGKVTIVASFKKKE